MSKDLHHRSQKNYDSAANSQRDPYPSPSLHEQQASSARNPKDTSNAASQRPKSTKKTAGKKIMEEYSMYDEEARGDDDDELEDI